MEKSVLTERNSTPPTSPTVAPVATPAPVINPALTAAAAIQTTTEPRATEVKATPWAAQVFYSLALIATIGGVCWAWMAARHFKAGLFVVAGALLAATVLRLVLPDRWAGLLASRHRLTDVVILLALGAGLLAVLLVLPARA